MRSSKSRSRGKSNRNNNRSPANNVNRVFDSSGPEGKVRGTPQQIIDKYTQLARDAFLSNDRVAAENFQQHAEHYTRLLAEAQRDAEEKRAAVEQANRDRQQQKAREREERERAREEQKAAQAAAPSATSEDPANAPQPDVVDVAPETGLVETPEEKPKRKPSSRSRKPRSSAPKPAAPKPESAPEPAETASE